MINALTRIVHGGRGDSFADLSHDLEASNGSNFKGYRHHYEDGQPSRTALLMTTEVPEDYWEKKDRYEVKRVHVKPRNCLYLPLDVYDCPVDPKYFKDTRSTYMFVENDDGSTSETQHHDSWRCLDNASDGRQDLEWTGYTVFELSSRYGKRFSENQREDNTSMFSLAVIPKELKTGKLSVDVFSEVLIRNHPCKTNKRVRLETVTGSRGQHDGMIELELCEEDQCNGSLGNLQVALISADERKPRLVLVCSEESNWFTKLENAIGQYMTIVTITADDDLLSMYGVNKVRSCLRDRNDAMFLAGPCTGGSSWARLNRTRSVETAMLVRRRQVMFWKLFTVFERLMEPRPRIQFRSLLELPRHCDYWKDPKMIRLIDKYEGKSNEFDGCCYGLREQFSHPPKYIKKPWGIISWGVDFDGMLSKKCDGRHEHAPCAGRETMGTQVYTSNIVSTILKKLNEDIDDERVVLKKDESSRSPLRVRTRSAKGKAVCAVPLCVIKHSNYKLEPFVKSLDPHLPDWISCSGFSPASDHLFVSLTAFSARINCQLQPSREIKETMATTSAQTPQTIELQQGSGGGIVDLFQTTAERAIPRTIVLLAKVVHEQDIVMPTFRRSVGMDINDAYAWVWHIGTPHLAALSFWLMTDVVNDERLMIWLFNLRRHGCSEDCKRTIKSYIDKMRMVCRTVLTMAGARNPGIFERLIDANLISHYDEFWDDLIKMFEDRMFPNVFLSSTLDDAYAVLAGGTRVDIGNMMYPPFHPIYEMREQEWIDIQLVYWDYSIPSRVPSTEHVQFIVKQMLEAGTDITLAIRLKNECVALSGGGEQDFMNEIKLAQKIVDMFFDGKEIAPPGDTAAWGAVHELLHYCSVSTLASMIVANRDVNLGLGLPCITEVDAAAINGALQQCANLLPELEPIKIAGWNIRKAEDPSVGDKGKEAKFDRDMRLKGLKTWAAWLSSPYDELHGLNSLAIDRRGRRYTFTSTPSDEFAVPPFDQWPKWARPDLLSMFMSRFGIRPEPKSRPAKVEPFVASGTAGKPQQHDFLKRLQESQSQSSSSRAGRPGFYDPKDDVWLHGVNFETTVKEEPKEDQQKKEVKAAPKASTFKKGDIPPLAYDPFTESADDEEVADEDEWTFPRVPEKLIYENYPRIGAGIIGKVGTIKLLVQPSFEMKPMIEEAVIPKQDVYKSTYSCYLRKVTSYIVAWTGCISHRMLRSYRRKGDDEWIRLYNYCLQQTGLGQSHLFLETRAMAALCDQLKNPEAIRATIKPVTSSTFLNQAATSYVDSHAISGNIRVTTTGLFTDFEIQRKSNKGNTLGIQSVLDHHFYWTSLHHYVAPELPPRSSSSRCVQAVKKATEFANNLSDADEATQAGASIHIWISFTEYVTWNKQKTAAAFSFNGFHEDSFIDALCNLVRESPVPVFVSFCAASEFHHGGEMQMERTIEKLAVELSRSGVAISTNRLMWLECSNFTDAMFRAMSPKLLKPAGDADDQWNRNAAFAILDKALFHEKMLYACVVGDNTVTEMEKALHNVVMQDVLSEPPADMQFVNPAKNRERIPIDKLRKMKITSTLLNADFNAVDPKVVNREDRFWYVVPERPSGHDGRYRQESAEKMVMCYLCSQDKRDGKRYDTNELYAGTCPNCAANLCREYYFMKHDPEEADVALRWAASILLQEQKDNPAWGLMQPADNIREWMWKTITTLRGHPSGVWKYVSHYGTTRMLFNNVANIMFLGQGKQITVDRHQQFDKSGTVRDYFQFSYDHGNRMYADYMRLMFPAEDLQGLINSLDPKEEALGDCIEVRLGVLKTAVMYEGCGSPLFRWRDVNGVLTGLETSLMVFNATAYASGVDNRKMKSGNSKGGSFGFESFRSIPNDLVPERRCPVMPTKDHRISVDAAMPDSTPTPDPTKGKVVDPVAPSTDAGKGSSVSTPGSKRRRLDQQLAARGQLDHVLDGIQKMLENNEVCRNCLNPEHATVNCPKPEANEWGKLLLKVRDGLSERKAIVKVEESGHQQKEVPKPDMKSKAMGETRNKEFIRQQKGRNPRITFYHKTISLTEVVGETEMVSYNVGGRHPQDLGFRDKGDFQRLLDRHMVESNFIPQVGYESQVSNELMPKFNHWKVSLKYGKIVPLPVQIEMFADPKYFGCGAIPGEFANRYDHNAMGDYTRRWNRILRHDIGRGAAPKCDELGWVDIESFVLNDFSWPKDDDMMIQGGRGARIDESVVGRRRRKLMEGYRHSMSPKAKKKRMLVVALYITPDELEEMWKHEDKDVFTEQVLRQCRGWIRPIALRATSGHSFHAPNKRPLMVNIDYKNLNMPFTKEIAAQVGGGYHVTSVKNLLSIVTKGLMPGGNAGTRDHVFFGEYAPWDPINTCTITWIAGEQEILVLYVPSTRLLKYRSGLTYNGDIVVGETVPFSEVQDAWIAHKSEFGGDVASGSRRIMSSKVTEEVVCQCDKADRGVPPQIIKGKVDRLITIAREQGKAELVEELKERWIEYSNDLSNGYVGAELGAAIALAAHELYPSTRGISRVCPNCMIVLPASLLFCPQCNGEFVSSGLTSRPHPVLVDLTKEQIEEIVREKEKELGDNIVDEEEDVKADDGAEDDPMGQPSADYSPDEAKDKDGDATMEVAASQWDDKGTETVIVEDDRDENILDSIQINHDRYPIDLPKITRPAYCTDVELKACRYLLFKLAKFTTDHFTTWKKHVLEKTDRQKREANAEGFRHDITGKGHPVEMETVTVDGVERQEPIYKDGLYVTVSDERARDHYHNEFVAKRTDHPPEENLRRYRFSVVVYLRRTS